MSISRAKRLICIIVKTSRILRLAFQIRFVLNRVRQNDCGYTVYTVLAQHVCIHTDSGSKHPTYNVNEVKFYNEFECLLLIL